LTLLVGWQEGHPACKKNLMPLPLTASCFSKIQIGFIFLVPAHLGSPVSPGKRAVKRVCVCVCVFACVCVCVCVCEQIIKTPEALLCYRSSVVTINALIFYDPTMCCRNKLLFFSAFCMTSAVASELARTSFVAFVLVRQCLMVMHIVSLYICLDWSSVGDQKFGLIPS